MKLEELKKDLVEKEAMKSKLEIMFHQTNGQIALLRDMIAKEEANQKVDAPKEEEKKEETK